jgi:hypothetical protein
MHNLGKKSNFLISHKILVIMAILMALMLIDTFLIRFYDLINKNIVPIMLKKIIFAMIAVTCLVVEFVVLRYVQRLIVDTQINKRIKVRFLNYVVYISQSVVVVLISYLILQIFYQNYYNSSVIVLIVVIVYGTASILIGKTLGLFISWYRVNHNSIFFIYSVSMFMIIVNLVLTSVTVSVSLNERPDQIRQFAGGSIDITAGKYSILSFLFKVSSVLAFASIWLTTALLMHTAKDQLIKEVRYWSILVIPLVYFLISYFAQDIFSNILFPFLRSDPVFVSLLLTSFFILSKPVGGLIFGILFWRISRLVSFEKPLQGYMIISGCGFLLLFSSNQSTSLVLAPYPPFGVSTITILVLATYLILIGIYISATFVSTNTNLRKFIYKQAAETRLLDLLGRVEAEREIERRVSQVVKKTGPSESSENASFDLDEDQLKDYLEKVLDEVGKKKQGG